MDIHLVRKVPRSGEGGEDQGHGEIPPSGMDRWGADCWLTRVLVWSLSGSSREEPGEFIWQYKVNWGQVSPESRVLCWGGYNLRGLCYIRIGFFGVCVSRWVLKLRYFRNMDD